MTRAIARTDHKARAETYRQRAAQLRALAEQLSGDEFVKLREAADAYDRMAAKDQASSEKLDGVGPKGDGASHAQE